MTNVDLEKYRGVLEHPDWQYILMDALIEIEGFSYTEAFDEIWTIEKLGYGANTVIDTTIIETTIAESTKTNKRFLKCKLADGKMVNVFPNNGHLARILSDGLQQYPDRITGDTFTVDPPMMVTVGENTNGWLNIISSKLDADFVLEPKISLYDSPQVQKISSQSACMQISQLAKSLDVVAFDFETTGIDVAEDEAVSIGIVSHDLRYYRLIKPTETGLIRLKTNGAIDIHKITPDMLEHEEPFVEIYLDLCKILSGKIWIAYNQNFDVTLLDRLCTRHNLPKIPRIGVFCAMKLYAEYVAEPVIGKELWVNHKLSVACEKMGVDLTNAHNALDDAMATHELLDAILVHQASA